MNVQLAAFICSILLMIIGIIAIVFLDNLIKKILGLMFLSDGVNLALVTIGFNPGGIVPIFTQAFFEQHPDMEAAVQAFAESAAYPLSFALVLTNIVIAVSILAVGLGLTIRLYHRHQSLSSSKILKEGES